MRRFPFSVVALACLCLLGLQVSGLPLHVDASGSDSGLHGMHGSHKTSESHGAHANLLETSDHDHGAEVDVQLLEQWSTSWAKLVPLISQVILLATLLWIVRPQWSPTIRSGKSRNSHHWRPPLRAPPISL